MEIKKAEWRELLTQVIQGLWWEQDILLWETEKELLSITVSENRLETSRSRTVAKLLEL